MHRRNGWGVAAGAISIQLGYWQWTSCIYNLLIDTSLSLCYLTSYSVPTIHYLDRHITYLYRTTDRLKDTELYHGAILGLQRMRRIEWGRCCLRLALTTEPTRRSLFCVTNTIQDALSRNRACNLKFSFFLFFVFETQYGFFLFILVLTSFIFRESPASQLGGRHVHCTNYYGKSHNIRFCLVGIFWYLDSFLPLLLKF